MLTRRVGASSTILAAGATPGLVLDLLMVLMTAGVVAMVMSRIRMSAAPAYIIAGVLIGPDAFALVSSPDSLEELARFATVLLMFGIGLQLHISALANALGRYIAAGLGSGLVTTLLVWPVAIGLGMPAPAAFVAAMALSLSSTAIVVQHLTLHRELNRSYARLALAILVVQDLAVLGMLAAIPVIAVWAGAADAPAAAGAAPDFARFVALSLGRLAVLAGLVVVARSVLPRILAEAIRGRGTDVLMVVATASAIGAAVVTQALGFSPELGAFLAGLTIAVSPARHQISGQIGPLRDLFIAIFFTTIGMRVAPGVVLDYAPVIALGLVATLAIKASVIGAAGWAVGAGGVTAALVGLLLAEAGEFSLLIFASADQAGVLTPTQFRVLVTITVFSLMLTPLLAWVGRRIAPSFRAAPLPPWLRRGITSPDHTTWELGGAAAAHGRLVIIAGFGPVGRAVAEALSDAGARSVVIELNPTTVQALHAAGERAIYGDVSNSEVLESAGVAGADALVVTIPDEESVLRASQAARRANAGILIVARATLASRAALAHSLGADHVVVDELATAGAMRDLVIAQLSDAPRRRYSDQSRADAEASISESRSRRASAPRRAPPRSPSPPP